MSNNADGAKEALVAKAPAVADGIVETAQLLHISLKGKWKMCFFPNSPYSKSGHHVVKFKKIVDTLPVFCADKNYKYINDSTCKRPNYLKLFSYWYIWTQHYGHARTNLNMDTVNPNTTIYV